MFGKPPGQPTLSKVLFFFKQQSPSKIKIYHQARRPNERIILVPDTGFLQRSDALFLSSERRHR